MRWSKPNLIRSGSLPFRPLSDELVLAARLRRVITARQARRHFFHPSLLAQPSWEMLLEAYLAFLEEREISVSALSDAAAVPATTGLRWVSKLEDEQMLVRKSDPLDNRRVWIELSPRGVSAMTRYFESIANALPI
jgi:DNA-binding MarR family transcriptional regulator